MSRSTTLLAACIYLVIGFSSRLHAGDFSIGGFYDPYSIDSLVANRDSVYLEMKQFGLDFIVSKADPVSTAYAQQHGFELVVAAGILQLKAGGSYEPNPIKLRDSFPRTLDSLAMLSYRPPDYEAVPVDAEFAYKFSTSRTGRHEQQSDSWECIPGTHDSGFALSSFEPIPTLTNYLGYHLAVTRSVLPVRARVTYYLGIGDTSTAVDPAVRLDVYQWRHSDTLVAGCHDPETFTQRDLYPQDFASNFNPQIPIFDTFSVEIDLCGSEWNHLRLWWYGTRTVYIDRVEIRCDGIADLFWDADIDSLADSIVAYYETLQPASALSDVYLLDEPYGAYLTTFQRAQQVFDTAAAKPGGVPVRMTTSHSMRARDVGENYADTVKWAAMKHYFDPERVFVQVYPYACFTRRSSDGTMDSTNLQRAFDRLRDNLAFTKELLDRADVDFLPLIQTGAFSQYDKDGDYYYYLLRDPSAAEVLCLANMSMCFLPAELAYYWYSAAPCEVGLPEMLKPSGCDYIVDTCDSFCDQCECWESKIPYNTALVQFDTVSESGCSHTAYLTPKWHTMKAGWP